MEQSAGWPWTGERRGGSALPEEGGNRIDVVDLTTRADSILVKMSIGAVCGVVGLAVQDHRLY